MPKENIPFATADVSALAKSLRAQLSARDAPPSHVEMLNMLARAAGHRNFQQFRAQAASRAAPAPPPVEAEPGPDFAVVEATLRHFDEQGRLVRWPARRRQQVLCLWALWARLPAGGVFAERELNALLVERHLFGDHALLRRDLFDMGLLSRTPDGREYRRVERQPPGEAKILIRRLSERPA